MFNRLNLKKRIFAFLAAVSGCLLLASAIFVFSPDAAAEETLTPESYIYFDLSAGNVEIYSLPGGSATYKGYRYDGESTKKEISGTYTDDLDFYVYQSDGNINTGIIGNKVVLPTHNRVSGWANYCTNNPKVEEVIGEWIKRAGDAGRKTTPNRIHVVGKVNSTIVIDNLYSSYTDAGQSRTTSAIAFLPQGETPSSNNVENSYLTIKFKGDNRFCSILYSSNKNTEATMNKLILEGYTEDATLTCANLEKNKKTNYWCAAIGGDDAGRDNSCGIFIKSGIIYAGTNAGDDCTAIGGGGNGEGIITISGGTVTASVTSSGAAIGGGIGKSSSGGKATVKITGGKVYAYNFSCACPTSYTYTGKATYIPAAAIGGGSSGKSTCNSCTVEISGDAYVYAESVGGTAIGGGSSADTTGGSAKVIISGDAEVHAYSVAGEINGVNVPAGAGIGGGTGGTGPIVNGAPLNADGGSVTLTIEGNAKVYTGSVGGGSTNDTKSKIGHAVITIKDNATVSGQFIMAEGANEHCSFTMLGGLIDNTGRKASDFLKKDGGAVYMDDAGVVTISGGTIKKCSGELGGAIYMTAGAFNLLGTGIITECTATNSGGAVYLGGGVVNIIGGSIINNTAAQNGGGVAISSGTFNLSGTGEIYQCTATNSGGAVYLGGGAVNISGGRIINNTAALNGGGVAITNGNYTMTGGAVNSNKAQTGNGGGIYVSSTSSSKILIRSGEVSHNTAGNGGGALGVHGPEDAAFTIQIGSNTDHNVSNATGQCHYYGSIEESCPVIINNKSHNVGGGIYLSGSYDAKLLMYCIVESGNEADGGASSSNFMKVEGGTLTIATRGENDELGPDFGKIVIKNSVHVTGGKVELRGLGDNPQFNDKITVDVTGNSYFHDLRDKTTSPAFTVQYFENFEENGVKSGQYISMDVPKDAIHIVQAGLYSHDGFLLKAWTLMKTIADGTHIPVDPLEEYVGNDKITVTQDIILYAKWEVAGYSIIFLPGVDSYGGTMNQLDLSYTQEANLTPNAFTNVGYIFKEWKCADTGEIYADKQLVSKLTDVDGAKIELIAQWEICYHTNFEAYSLSSTTDSISRECNCLGYTETATLEGFTVTYDGAEHHVRLTCSAQSKNGEKPSTGVWTESTFPVSYAGKNWDNIDFSNPVVPLNAGNYTATISFPQGTPSESASVGITINKATRTPPPAPQYNIPDGGDTVIITDAYAPDLQYMFTWYYYEGTEKKTDNSGWMSRPDASSTITFVLKKTYTNYYVDVKYAETANYLESLPVRGTSAIIYTEHITFSISSDPNLIREESWGKGEDGITVSFTPQSNQYYIYDITTSKFESNYSGSGSYTLPVIVHKEPGATRWETQITNINKSPDDSNIIITIHFTGAELKPTVEADTVKDQVFSSIYNKGEANISISKDSAYTVRFDVDNYKHYSDPMISFDRNLPVGTTLVMIDGDSSYWGYTVETSPVSSVLLSNFVRMGSTDADTFTVADNRTSLDLQFVVDFSRCATPLDPTILTAQFNATPIHPQQTIQTVPSLPSEGDALSQVTLVEIPQFTINEDVGTFDDPEVENIAYNYAISAENVGISKWQSRKGVLVITPSSTLPADARLQVTIGNSTNIYGLKDGRYIVALTSGNSGEVSITFLSDMVPVGTYNFSVEFYASETLVGSTPKSELDHLDGKLSYTVTKSAPIGLIAEITSSLPQFIPRDENGKPSITSLGYSVSTLGLPSGYSVKATLYGKNPDGKGYSATTQSSTLDVSKGTEFTLELASLAEGMTTKLGSLSMMLRIEVLDSNGKVVTYYPLYFIVVDPR